jgi:DedD protein
MRLPFLRSKSTADAAQRPRGLPDDPSQAQVARTRARQRLVGALVLLGVGVVSFPLLFDTQPRPLSQDIPMAAPRDAGSLPPRGTGRALAPLPVLPADAGVEGPAAPASEASAVPAAPAPSASVAVSAAPTPRASAPEPAPAVVSAAPAPSLPAPAASTSTARFVVQIGAFAEARALRDARQKAEGLGLKTYIQVIDNDGAKRTRLRVGPFDTRQQADAAAKTLKTGGLPAAVLTL